MADKSLPGVDRIGKQTRSAIKVAAEKELATHRKLCDTCHRAGTKIDQYCDDGWQLARAIHVAKAAKVRAQIRQERRQGRLFD